MIETQVLYDNDGVFVFAYITEDNCLDLEYNDNKCPFAGSYEHHTTLTPKATQKLCKIYQCDIMHLPQKVKEYFAQSGNEDNSRDIEVTGKSIDKIFELYKEVTIEGRFQKFCDENQLEYKTFTWTSDKDDIGRIREDDDNQAVEKANTEAENKNFRELIEAVANQDKTKVRAMIKDGIDINMSNEHGRTALMMAEHIGDLDMVKILVEAGANLEQATKDNETAFLYACRVTENVEIIEYLIKQGVNTQAKTIYGNNALFVAAEYNKNWQVAEYLINTKLYDINDQNCNNAYTPLMAAVRYNNVDVINVLIDHGANLYAKDADGWLPVLHAAANYDDNPMNLIRLLGLDPQLFFFNVGKENLRQVSEDNHNLNIRLALDSILSIYLFFGKKPSKKLPN